MPAPSAPAPPSPPPPDGRTMAAIRGQKYSPAGQINAGKRRRADRRTGAGIGDMTRRDPAPMQTKDVTTPILADGRLLISMPFNEVIALDPGTGAELWRFDPMVDTSRRPGNAFNCRGVVHWRDAAATVGAVCAARVFFRHLPGACWRWMRRRAALRRFRQGWRGADRLGMAEAYPGEIQISSAPVVICRQGDRRLGDVRQPPRRRPARHGQGVRRAHRRARLELRSGAARSRRPRATASWGEG